MESHFTMRTKGKKLTLQESDQYVRNCEMIRTLTELYETNLSKKEKEFLENIEGRLRLSEKQQTWLDDIWDDCFYNRS